MLAILTILFLLTYPQNADTVVITESLPIMFDEYCTIKIYAHNIMINAPIRAKFNTLASFIRYTHTFDGFTTTTL